MFEIALIYFIGRSTKSKATSTRVILKEALFNVIRLLEHDIIRQSKKYKKE